MSRTRFKPQQIISLLLIVIAVALWGCSDELINPVPDTPPALDDHPPGGNDDPPITDSGTEIDASTGGTVVIETGRDDAECHLVVTAQSLVENTTISAELTEFHDGDTNFLDFEFGPDGLSFNSPAWLEIDAALFQDPGITLVAWYYYHPTAKLWILQGQFPVINGVVRIPIRHFSVYRGLSQGGQINEPQAK